MDNYKVVKKAISYELANFLFNYFLLKREAVAHMYDTNMTYDSGMLGTWKDKQIPNTYSIYGDPTFDTLLMKVLLPWICRLMYIQIGRNGYVLNND